MATHRLPNYLRTYRKRTGLTQEEVAFLLGCHDGGKVSRHERLTREPNLQTALAFEAVLGAPTSELFAGVFEKVVNESAERARLLHSRLCQVPASAQTARKLRTLERIIAE